MKTKELPVKTGAALLDINRTSVYYKGMPISQEELDCKLIIDRLHTDNPAWGARQLSAQLKKRGYQVGRRKTRRYMNEMGIDPIYPKMNLSKRMQQAKVCPYLLRNAVIDRPNQAWSIDITYIAIKHGFLYLTAVIDWYSRCIVGWEVDDTLDTRMVITALKKAFMVAKPVILNSDQGCQFTSNEYMNSRGSAGDIASLEKSDKVYYIGDKDSAGKSNKFVVDGTQTTIYWDPDTAYQTTEGIWISPATVLAHEVGHAIEYDKQPNEFMQNVKKEDGDYDNIEERRNITTTEQKAARKHKEIKDGTVTRRNHKMADKSNVNNLTPYEIEDKFRKINEFINNSN